MSFPATVLAAALRYAERGWHVIPLHSVVNGTCTCQKRAECKHPGKHPRIAKWQHAASASPEMITAWFERWPEANVGIVTGKLSGVLVLDIDNKTQSDGSAAFQYLKEEHNWATETLTAKTGTGWHYFYLQPSVACRNSASALGCGIDVRSDGGYIVAAPSKHANGENYSWIDYEAPLERLPESVVGLLSGTSGRAALDTAEDVMQGSRNQTLTRLAGRLRSKGVDQQGLTLALGEFNQSKCVPPLSQGEVAGIAQSIGRRPAGNPNGSAYLPWYPFYPGEWFTSVQGMEDYQRGQYMNLLSYCWGKEGLIPADPALLWRLAGAKSKAAFEMDGADQLVLNEFVPIEMEGKEMLLHPGMAELHRQQAKKYKQKCDASAKAAAGRNKGSQGDSQCSSVDDE